MAVSGVVELDEEAFDRGVRASHQPLLGSSSPWMELVGFVEESPLAARIRYCPASGSLLYSWPVGALPRQEREQTAGRQTVLKDLQVRTDTQRRMAHGGGHFRRSLRLGAAGEKLSINSAVGMKGNPQNNPVILDVKQILIKKAKRVQSCPTSIRLLRRDAERSARRRAPNKKIADINPITTKSISQATH